MTTNILYATPLITAYCVFVTALSGLVFGSFCNAWAWRLVHGESITRGRSHCASCGHTLSARDLVPLVSYLSLHGKCRYCGAPIGKRYPLAEVTLALAFVALVLRYGLTLTALRFLIVAALLLVASLTDLESQEIADRLQVMIAAAALLRLPVEGLAGLKAGVLGAVAVALPLLLFVLAADKIMKRETMGGADIKLFFVLGLHFSPLLMLMLLIFACFIGIFFALATQKGRGVAFPFGPAIALAALMVALFGDGLLNWYLSLFF